MPLLGKYVCFALLALSVDHHIRLANASEFGLSCMQATALDATLRTPALTAYTYPVRGQRGVAPSFDCREIPNPCDAVPNNDGRTPTGFNISVQFNGPWATIAGVDVDSATVAAAGRPPVDVIVQTRERVLRGGMRRTFGARWKKVPSLPFIWRHLSIG